MVAAKIFLHAAAVSLGFHYGPYCANDRSREATYALNIIFPQTRQVAVVETEKHYIEVDLTLKGLGWDCGWREVARFAGLITLEAAGETAETMLADTERTMAANARMLTRAGHVDCKVSPDIRQPKVLMENWALTMPRS